MFVSACHARNDGIKWEELESIDGGAACIDGWVLTTLFLGKAFPLHVTHPNDLTYSLEMSPADPINIRSTLWRLDPVGDAYRIRNAHYSDGALSHEVSLDQVGDSGGDRWTIVATQIPDQGGGVYYRLSPETNHAQGLATSFAPPYRPLLVPGQANLGHLWSFTAYYHCEN